MQAKNARTKTFVFLSGDQGLSDELTLEFSMETIIYNLLNQAYYKAIGAKGEGMLSSKEDLLIFGYDNVYSYLYEFFSQKLEEKENRLFMEAPTSFCSTPSMSSRNLSFSLNPR